MPPPRLVVVVWHVAKIFSPLSLSLPYLPSYCRQASQPSLPPTHPASALLPAGHTTATSTADTLAKSTPTPPPPTRSFANCLHSKSSLLGVPWHRWKKRWGWGGKGKALVRSLGVCSERFIRHGAEEMEAWKKKSAWSCSRRSTTTWLHACWNCTTEGLTA